MDDKQWGYGSGAKGLNGEPMKPFGISRMDDGTPFDLVLGEHPHSRSDDNIYARFADGRVEAFDGHRILHRVELRTFNYLKCSGLSGNEVRKGGQYRIYFNDRLVWAEFFREVEQGLRRAANVIGKLHECPLDLWEINSPKLPRKVYWMNQPAVITAFDVDENTSDGNSLVIEAESQEFAPTPWRREACKSVRVECLSPHIWWWRE